MIWQDFIKLVNNLSSPRILELGTKRSKINKEKGTIHKAEFNNLNAEYLGLDIESGLDVDIVGDVHKLSQVVGEESFDVIISCSTFEHFKYPFLAAYEIVKTLKINGYLFIQTHQCFPLHAYPNDYFRFSTDALMALFGTKLGFKIINTWYEFKAGVLAPRIPALWTSLAYLNSNLIGQKFEKTPENFIYELN